MLSGAELHFSGVLDPHGPVARAERLILFDATAIMLAVVVPVMLATLAIAWWFRSGNARAEYRPDWSFSGRLEFIVWSIPAMVVMFLGGIGWMSSHDLDPYQPLESKAPVLEVQVVSLDWKWLFIYPAQGVASVNRLVVPAGAPVHFRLTSATVMNSFFVPELGSQIYTMAGMVTQLYLQADRPGSYYGMSAQFSGDGFSDMRFDAVAVSGDDFTRWVADAQGAGAPLDLAAYATLARASERVAPRTYRTVADGLFDQIVDFEAPPADGLPQGGPADAISPLPRS